MKNWRNKIKNTAENQDWNVKLEKNGYCLFEIGSPEGQDCCIEFDNINSYDELVENLSSYCDNYDVSYETYLWLDSDGHGTNGAPYDMKDVYEGMQWFLNKAEELLETIRNLE